MLAESLGEDHPGVKPQGSLFMILLMPTGLEPHVLLGRSRAIRSEGSLRLEMTGGGDSVIGTKQEQLDCLGVYAQALLRKSSWHPGILNCNQLAPGSCESDVAHSLQNFLGLRPSFSFRTEANILSLLFQSNLCILKCPGVSKMQPPHYFPSVFLATFYPPPLASSPPGPNLLLDCLPCSMNPALLGLSES